VFVKMAKVMSWTEPISVMDQVINNLDPSDDFIAFTEAEEAIKQTTSQREKEAEEVREQFRALSRLLEAARMSASRPRTVPSEVQHAKILQDLEGQQVSLGKATNEIQDTLRDKEVQVVRMRAEERELETLEEAEKHDLDSTALKLQLTRDLGFEVIPSKGNEPSRILVSSESGDIHCVALDKALSEFEIAQRCWELTLS